MKERNRQNESSEHDGRTQRCREDKCQEQKVEQKEEEGGEVAAGRRVLIRLSDRSAITASIVDTSNSIWLFKVALNFTETRPRDKD